MMGEVADGLFVGDEESCTRSDVSWGVVHACKHPCHQRDVGYRSNLPQSHAEYLVAQRETDIYLNLVDMDRKLSHEYTEPIISATFDFIDEYIDSRNILIHCNQGVSRSPSLAMLYLAKRAGDIPNDSYDAAREAFGEVYPDFRPGRGIEAYLADYWAALD